MIFLPNVDPLTDTKHSQFLKDVNPFSRTYVLGVGFDDFVDISHLNLSVKGFIFQKVIAFKTKAPLHSFFMDLLISYIDTLKVNRSADISEKISQGSQLEDIDIMKYDSDYSNLEIFQVFKKTLEELPSLMELKFEEQLSVSHGPEIRLNFTLQGKRFKSCFESFPCKLS